MTSVSLKPLVVLCPAPQRRDRIFSAEMLERLHERFEVLDLEANPDPNALARVISDAFAIVGQPDLPAELLERADRLTAIVNVEGNFFPNVDYPTAFSRGVRVLGCGPAYGQAVAEYSLALALDAARGISREDRAMRAGAERYVSAGNADAVLLRGADVALIGYGNLGRSLCPILKPFSVTVRAYDPWLPPSVLEMDGLRPSSLEDALSNSQFVFVFATATQDSEHLLNAERLALLPNGARLILVSRAAVVDYDALLSELRSGRIYAAIDVWPEEPVPADSAFRSLSNAILSPHRAGGIPQAFFSIGEMVCDDLELMAEGLPPVRLQIGAPELIGKYRNKPVT